jgi:hypothetical protein
MTGGAPDQVDGYGRLAMCAAVTIYAISSARSWQRKLDPVARPHHGYGRAALTNPTGPARFVGQRASA